MKRRGIQVLRWAQRNAVGIALSLTALAAAIAVYAVVQDRNSVIVACKVQQQGLAASQQIERFFVDYNQLLGIQINTAAGKKQLAQLPPNERKPTVDAIAAVSAYSRIVSHQPKHRKCP